TPAGATAPVRVDLSYERASGTLQSPLAGGVPDGSPLHEVRIDSEGGLWSSGWLPIENGLFQTDVMLSDHKPLTRFTITGRDRSGRGVPVSPAAFAIAFMLPMAAPPLPHT